MKTLFTKNHEWVAQESEGLYKVGITDYAQSQLGDIVFIDLPKVGAEVSAGSVVSVIESVKAASDIYAPISGTIEAANQALDANPATVNSDAETTGWIFTIKADPESSAKEFAELMSLEEYKKINM